MKAIKNQQFAHLLTWEVNPNKRNENNIITLYCSEDLKEGDFIIGDVLEHRVSCYEVTEIIEKRNCKLKSNKHYTCRTEHSFKPVQWLKETELIATDGFKKSLGIKM